MVSFESELAALVALWGRKLSSAEIIKALQDALDLAKQDA